MQNTCCYQLLESVTVPHKGVVHNPEAFGGAGGELFVIAMVLSWVLTALFNYEFLLANPLKDRVGYNNLCVGWDTPPAKYVSAPIFAAIIYCYMRYCVLGFWRADLDPTVTKLQRRAVALANVANGWAWFMSIGIFTVDPRDWPLGHTECFVQLVVFNYIGYLFNFFECKSKYHPAGSWIFTGVWGVTAVSFGICATIQMVMYDPVTKQMGPVPWYFMMFLDYAYFTGMALQGNFRPRAPSIGAKFCLVDDEDFTIDKVAYAKAERERALEEARGGGDAPSFCGVS